MTFRDSFGKTVSSFIRNFAPWGIFASLAVAFIAYQLVKRVWPDLTTAIVAVVTVPVAVAIFVVGFVGFAAVVAILNNSNARSD